MDFNIEDRTIFLTLTGSRVYGTADESSDYDYRGVAIPPKRYFLGSGARFDPHEQHEPHDTTVVGINKFLKLAADNNPNVMELLWIPEKFWTVVTPAWRSIVAARDLFLSKKCYHTFRGYAHSQLRRVKSHRAWLLQGEVPEPTRENFGLDPRVPLPQEIVGAADAVIALWLQQTDIEEDLAEIARHDKSLARAFRQRLWEFLELHLGISRMEIEGSCGPGRPNGWATRIPSWICSSGKRSSGRPGGITTRGSTGKPSGTPSGKKSKPSAGLTATPTTQNFSPVVAGDSTMK